MENVENKDQQAADVNVQMQQAFWDGKPHEQANQEEVIPPPVDPPNKDGEEILDPKDWLKREFDTDDIQVLKQEREELRKLRETAQTPAEIKYANEQSKLLHEAILAGKEDVVYDFLDKKKRISSSDKMSAADVIKLNLNLKNPHYDSQDVEDIFLEQYTHPKKPVQATTELDEDFQAREQEWKSEVDRINRKIERDAKDAKVELAKYPLELVLPDIPKKESPKAQAEPTPEELAKESAYKDTFLKSADNSVKNFTGFSTNVKDKDVDYAISYGTSKEENDFVSNQIRVFAEGNYNANDLLAQRWVNEDKTINTDQMTKDLHLLFHGEKAFQKMASDSAAQRLELYLKEKRNVNLTDIKQGDDFTPNNNQTEHQKMQEHFWNN
jgi:hypothetical protein